MWPKHREELGCFLHGFVKCRRFSFAWWPRQHWSRLFRQCLVRKKRTKKWMWADIWSLWHGKVLLLYTSDFSGYSVSCVWFCCCCFCLKRRCFIKAHRAQKCIRVTVGGSDCVGFYLVCLIHCSHRVQWWNSRPYCARAVLANVLQILGALSSYRTLYPSNTSS